MIFGTLNPEAKVKWLHLTGEVDKCVRCSSQIFSGFNGVIQKNKKVDVLVNTV